MTSLARCIALLALATLSLPAHAERYRVDLIVFLDRTNSSAEAPQPAAPPDLSHALEPLDAEKLKDAGIELVPDDAFGLAEQWKKLQNSRRFQPLIRLAWIEKDPPSEHGTGLHLRWGAAIPLNTANNASIATGSSAMYPVDGTVTLLLSRYLHLDAVLAYTQPGPDGAPVTYRLDETRRMRRDELHYLDSPRLGILARVEKADKVEKPKPAPKPAPTPKKKPAAKRGQS